MSGREATGAELQASARYYRCRDGGYSAVSLLRGGAAGASCAHAGECNGTGSSMRATSCCAREAGMAGPRGEQDREAIGGETVEN